MVKNKLKIIIDGRGIKQTWLAQQAGVTKTTMGNIVNNRFNTSLEVAIRIARALNMTVEDIFDIVE
jgi:DNA-binding XRE family transcriptional regulator